MLVPNDRNSSDELMAASQTSQTLTIPPGGEGDRRPTQVRIRIQIPKQYHQEPVISRLISQYDLTVNFKAALLGTQPADEGWFDLELFGAQQQIDSALMYLNDLDVKIWSNSAKPDEETW